MPDHTSARIQAVTVNHNTSRYVELLLRSLSATHAADLDIAVTVVNNDSHDDMTSLRALLDQQHIPLRPSGFSTATPVNSHGEVLRQFVLDQADCAYYLFLDADVCFLEAGTIDAMLAQLEAAADLFGVGVRQTWDGRTEIPADSRHAIYHRRLHPCCALVRNTALFRRVVDEIGLTGVTYHWVGGEQDLDTFELLTKVLRTHDLYHAISPKLVYHFFNVSYDAQWMEQKNQRRDALLATLRNQS